MIFVVVGKNKKSHKKNVKQYEKELFKCKTFLIYLRKVHSQEEESAFSAPICSRMKRPLTTIVTKIISTSVTITTHMKQQHST